jgi:hypothetical protein
MTLSCKTMTFGRYRGETLGSKRGKISRLLLDDGQDIVHKTRYLRLLRTYNSLGDLIKAGLAQIQGVIIQIERNAQLNDVVTIFLVNDVLTVVNYSLNLPYSWRFFLMCGKMAERSRRKVIPNVIPLIGRVIKIMKSPSEMRRD